MTEHHMRIDESSSTTDYLSNPVARRGIFDASTFQNQIIFTMTSAEVPVEFLELDASYRHNEHGWRTACSDIFSLLQFSERAWLEILHSDFVNVLISHSLQRVTLAQF